VKINAQIEKEMIAFEKDRNKLAIDFKRQRRLNKKGNQLGRIEPSRSEGTQKRRKDIAYNHNFYYLIFAIFPPKRRRGRVVMAVDC
jgi:hypothetical protein